MATELITETTVKQSKQRMDRGHCWEVTKTFWIDFNSNDLDLGFFSLDYNNSVRSWIQINRIMSMKNLYSTTKLDALIWLIHGYSVHGSSVGLASLCQSGLNRYYR